MQKNSLVEETLGSTYKRCMSLHSNLYPECGEYYKKDRNDDLYSSCGITKSFDCKFRVVGLMAIHEEHIGVEGGMG
jgi:hypothetical protein